MSCGTCCCADDAVGTRIVESGSLRLGTLNQLPQHVLSLVFEGQETRQKSKDAGEVVFSDNGILPDSLDPVGSLDEEAWVGTFLDCGVKHEVGSLKEASDNRTTHRVSGRGAERGLDKTCNHHAAPTVSSLATMCTDSYLQ
eukprot:1788485-Amphidinium_carterae.1